MIVQTIERDFDWVGAEVGDCCVGAGDCDAGLPEAGATAWGLGNVAEFIALFRDTVEDR